MLQSPTIYCPLDCPDGCSIKVECASPPGSDVQRVTRISGTAHNPLTDNTICAKVRQFSRQIYSKERIQAPLRRRGEKGAGQFEEISWDNALNSIAERLGKIRAQHGPRAIFPYHYSGSNGLVTEGSADATFFSRLGVVESWRTLCAGPSTTAGLALYGGMPGGSLLDLAHAQLVVLWGVNPSATGIHALKPIKAARKDGAQLVVIDPRRTPLAAGADLHLALKPGTDVALALCTIRSLTQDKGGADHGFIAQHTVGSSALIARAARWTVEHTAEVCGVAPADIQKFITLYTNTSKAMIRCGWGLERNRNGGSSVAAVLALPAIAGKFGGRGSGFIMSNSRAMPRPEEKVPEHRINMIHLGRALQGVLPATAPIHALFVYNTNPVATAPEQARVIDGMARENLYTIVFDTVMTDTARYADIVLPATTFFEHEELKPTYGAMGLYHSKPALLPLGQAKSNFEVFTLLQERMGLGEPHDPQTSTEYIDLFAEHHLSEQQQLDLRSTGWAIPDIGDRPLPFVNVWPNTSDKKIHFFGEGDALSPTDQEKLYLFQENPFEGGPLTLITPADRRCISSTLAQHVDDLAILHMHKVDAQNRGLVHGQRVRVFNPLGELHTRLKVCGTVRPGVVSFPKGVWLRQTQNQRTANTLIPDHIADFGGGACYNDAKVDVESLEESPKPA